MQTFKQKWGGGNIIIHNGIVFKQTKQILDKNEFNIVCVGRLEEHKNFQLAIKALAKVKFDFKLYILGEGVYENELKKLVNDLKIEHKIKFLGFVDNPQDYIASSNMQLLFSRLEGFSLALIDGIYYGKMVFAIDVANHKEILGSDFILENDEFAVANKLNEVYENYESYVNSFKKIKEKSKQYDIKNVALKYIKAYESLLDKINKKI